MANPLDIFGMLLNPVKDIFVSRQDRKKAQEAAKAKLKMAAHDSKFQLDLNDQEWEALGKQAEDGTWKDEYVTLVITLPIPMILIGAVYQAFTGDDRLLVGVNEGILGLQALGLNMGDLMYIVVLAAVGIKGIKSIK